MNAKDNAPHHPMRKLFIATKQRLAAVIAPAVVFALAGPAHAGYDIGAPTTGMFGKIGAFMQEVIDFIDGPTALFFTVISIVVGGIMYAMAPKNGAMGMLVRVIIAGIVVLNVATWVVALKNGG